MALDGSNGETQAYWLQNKRVRSATNFCFVTDDGFANYYYASYSFGVRPLYRIRNYR